MGSIGQNGDNLMLTAAGVGGGAGGVSGVDFAFDLYGWLLCGSHGRFQRELSVWLMKLAVCRVSRRGHQCSEFVTTPAALA